MDDGDAEGHGIPVAVDVDAADDDDDGGDDNGTDYDDDDVVVMVVVVVLLVLGLVLLVAAVQVMATARDGASSCYCQGSLFRPRTLWWRRLPARCAEGLRSAWMQ